MAYFVKNPSHGLSLPERAQRTWAHVAPAGVFTAAHAYSAAAAGMSALIVYLSLMPFQFVAQPWGAAWDRFAAAMAPHPAALPDFLSNLLLFIPLGYLALGAGCANADRKSSSVLDLVMALTACAILSVTVEFGQIFVRSRRCDGNDVLAQMLGACIGTATWLLLGHRLTRRAVLAWEYESSAPLAAPLFFGYLLLLVFLQMLPFAFLPSSAVWQRLDLAAARGWTPIGREERLIWDVLYFLPAGLLGARAFAARFGWQRVLAMALGVAVLVKGVDLFIRGRVFEPRQAIVGVFAFCLGWWLSRAQDRAARHHSPFLRMTPGLVILGVLAGMAWILASVYLIHGEFVDFPDDFGPMFRRLREARWIPLVELSNAQDRLLVARVLGQKMLLFVPLGLLVRVMFPRLSRMEFGLPALVAGGMAALFLDFGPTVLTHETGVSAILFETGGAWLGFGLAGITLRQTSEAAEMRVPAPKGAAKAPGFGGSI